MTRIRTCFALAALACGPRIDPGPIVAEAASQPVRLHTLPPTEGSVLYVEAVVSAGSARDPVGHEGLAHLVARSLVDGGAGARDATEVRADLYPTGNDLTVRVDREWVSLRLTCHRDHAPRCLEIFADALTAPRFAEGDWLRSRDDAVHTLDEVLPADGEALGLAALEALLHEGHPYAHPAAGRSGVVPVQPVDLGRRFYARHYVRRGMVVGLAGAWTEEMRDTLADRLLAVPGDRLPEFPLIRPPTAKGLGLLAVHGEAPTTGFHLGHPIEVDRLHADYAALLVATMALGAHRESFGRLTRALRGDRGLNYGTYAYIEPWTERGQGSKPEQAQLRRDNRFVVWIRPTSVDNGPFALKLTLDEIRQWADAGLTNEEFETTRAWLSQSLPLLAPTPGRRLSYALEALASDTPDLLEVLPDALATLTLDDVNAAVTAHIRPDDLQIVAVSGDPAGLVAALAEESATPIVYGDIEPDEAQSSRDAEVASMHLDLTGSWISKAEGIFR